MNFLEKAMDDLYQSVHAYVSKAFNTLSERMAAVEKRVSEIPAGPKGEKGDPGKDADPAYIEASIQKAVAAIPLPKDGAPGRDGTDGKDADPEFIRAEIEKAVSQLPTPKDGRDGVDGKDGRDGVDGKDGSPGRDGKDVDPEEVRSIVKSEVAMAVSSIPPAKDGKDVDLEQVSEAIRLEVEKAVSQIPVPKNGRDGKDADMGSIKLSITEFFEQTANEFCKGLDDVA